MKLEDLPGIGKAIADKLREAGVESIEQVAKLTEKELEALGVNKDKASEALKIAKEKIKKPDDPPKNKNVVDIWRIKKEIPSFLFKAFIKTLKKPSELTETELNNKYDDFMNKKLF